MRFNTIASFFAAFTNAVQLSECVQLALSKKGSTPLDPMIPRRYRRLAAVLQIPVLIALLAGEVSKVRAAFDGDDDDDEDWSDEQRILNPGTRWGRIVRRGFTFHYVPALKCDPTCDLLNYLGGRGFEPNRSKVEWVES